MSSLRRIPKHPAISLLESSITNVEIKQIHAHLLINGLLNDPLLLAQFVATIAIHQPTHLPYSDQILQQWKNPNVFALNAMMRAYSKSPTPAKSVQLYRRMLHSRDHLFPDNYTFTFLIRACTQLLEKDTGLSVHATLLKRGFEHDPHVRSGLVTMYAQLGLLRSSKQVYMGVEVPDLVTETALLSACVKSGDVDFAREVFDKMPQRDPIAWNAMISGYAQCGQSRKALDLFHSMQMEGVKVSEVSMISVLSACTQLGALDQGRWAHAYIERNKLKITVKLGTSLVDMYAKCGDMDKAMKIFWGLNIRNVYSWSSAIGGLALNGAGEKCLELFSLMKEEGVQPNEVTFISILRGCSVAGLVDEGCHHFESMRGIYGIKPQLEHYGCMVDLYGRAGRLEEALEVINKMPMKPHSGAWGALLNACRIHRNMEMGELASKRILELEAKNHGAYVLLSNMYAESKNWDDSTSVRQMMKSEGVSKPPGCSVMEVEGEVHEFTVGNYKSHHRYGEINEMLEEISRRLRLFGYVANTNPVLFDIQEEEKEDALSQHSEKVAIAFGLISLKEDVPIRIVKNLRVCSDCHEVTKMISKAFNREIIVRDRNRFHHFKDGQCSCKEYW